MTRQNTISSGGRIFRHAAISVLLLSVWFSADAGTGEPAHFFDTNRLLNSRIVLPSEVEMRAPEPLTSVVTDTNPRAILPLTKQKITDPSIPTGPFNAHRTVMLHILSVYDRRTFGRQPFTQITRFILPNGSLYGTRSVSVTPSPTPAEPPTPVGIAPVRTRGSRLGLPTQPVPRQAPVGVERGRPLYTEVLLPVSGTWITRHNLYGEWKVEIEAVRDGEVLASTTQSFTIGLD